MDAIGQLLQPVFDAVAAFMANPVVQSALWALGAYAVLLWLAASWWAFRDAGQRSRNLLAPYLAAVLIILASPLLFLPALLLYRIIRPPETLASAEDRLLGRRALEAEVAQRERCGACGRRVDPEWLRCPTCRNRLRLVCPRCNRLVGLDWSLCAWCGHDFE